MNDEYGTLLTPLVGQEKQKVEESPRTSFINYLNILEGYKTKIKNLHWSAPAMNIHEKLDDFLDILSEYQDAVAEESMGIYGQIAPNVISGKSCDCIDALSTLESLKTKTNAFYLGLGDKLEHVGLRSETETFIHQINKYLYLFRLCKG